MKLPWYIKTGYSKGNNGMMSNDKGHLYFNIVVNKWWVYYQIIKLIPSIL